LTFSLLREINSHITAKQSVDDIKEGCNRYRRKTKSKSPTILSMDHSSEALRIFNSWIKWFTPRLLLKQKG